MREAQAKMLMCDGKPAGVRVLVEGEREGYKRATWWEAPWTYRDMEPLEAKAELAALRAAGFTVSVSKVPLNVSHGLR